jgi:hypothetical protein
MGDFILEAPVRFWKCPSCGITDKTQRPDVHTQFHPCPALGNVTIPLVEIPKLDDRPKARQVVVQSEYGYERAAVRTERLDGSNDVTVFPQPAVATGSSRV